MTEQDRDIQGTDQTGIQQQKLWVEVLAVVVIALAIFIPRVLKLDQFVTPDEPLWITRSANFYYALTHGDFASTFQREHPGVTTMWAGTGGFLARFRGYRITDMGQIGGADFHNFLKYTANVHPLDLLEASRFFMVLGNTIALLVAYLYVRKLIGLLPALIGFLLIAFEPFNLALTRLLHLDGLLSSLFLLSLVAFIYFLESRRWRDLIISGVAAGFCWLTKSPAFFLGPAIGLIALVQAYRSYRGGNQSLNWKHVWDFIWPVLIWGVTGMFVFVVFWPAMWVDPLGSLSSVLLTATAAAESGHASGIYFRGSVSVERGLSFAYFYPLTYLWRTTPLVLLGLVIAVWSLITNREPFDRPIARTTVLGFVIAVMVFTLGMTLGAKKIGRYMLPVYGPLTLIAAMGWVSLSSWIRDRKIPFLSKYSYALVLIPVVALQMYSSLRTYPYYFPYYNPLMGGSRVAPEVLQIGWGEGLDQAADYLNQQPGSEELEVLSWYAKGGFSYFFDGQTLDMGYDPDLSDSERKKISRADYILVYINQLQKNRPAELLEILADRDPVKIIEINGIEYVRIYKMK
jgi:hypothetical protein